MWSNKKYHEAFSYFHIIIAVVLISANPIFTRPAQGQDVNRVENAKIENIDINLFFNLGEAHYKNGNYSESLKYYKKYSTKKNISQKRKFLLACKMASCQFAIYSSKNLVEYNSEDLRDSESTIVDYWPVPSKDSSYLVFSRLNDSLDLLNNDIFLTELDSVKLSEGRDDLVTNNSGDEVSKLNTPEDQIVFFTACNNSESQGSCDIFFSRFINGLWTESRNAGSSLNSEEWDAQPHYDKETNYLYFVSNRNGGQGQKDIWRAKLLGFNVDGTPKWNLPENMGSNLNTTGNEVSPFFHSENGSLYFASDERIGMGGIDLFRAKITGNGEAGYVENLGYPINTKADELGVMINSVADSSYFAVGRSSDTGLIVFAYNLVRGIKQEPIVYVKSVINDEKSGGPIKAQIELINVTSPANKNQFETVNEKGESLFFLKVGREYVLNVTKPGYLFYSNTLKFNDTHSIAYPFVLNVKLKPIEIGAEIELYNIYYESDSYAILPNSEIELQKLVSFLKTNKNVKVEIQGHTDNTGNAENNLRLSNFRAKSIVDYLKANQVDLNRLQHKGYGDSMPIESNDTEAGRQMNRRTTLKILGN